MTEEILSNLRRIEIKKNNYQPTDLLSACIAPMRRKSTKQFEDTIDLVEDYENSNKLKERQERTPAGKGTMIAGLSEDEEFLLLHS